MSRRPFRLQPDEPPFLELASLGRAGPPGTTRFSPAQIEQIRRTVKRTPEVMVKVTGALGVTVALIGSWTNQNCGDSANARPDPNVRGVTPRSYTVTVCGGGFDPPATAVNRSPVG